MLWEHFRNVYQFHMLLTAIFKTSIIKFNRKIIILYICYSFIQVYPSYKWKMVTNLSEVLDTLFSVNARYIYWGACDLVKLSMAFDIACYPISWQCKDKVPSQNHACNRLFILWCNKYYTINFIINMMWHSQLTYYDRFHMWQSYIYKIWIYWFQKPSFYYRCTYSSHCCGNNVQSNGH